MNPQTLEISTDRAPFIREPIAPVSSGFKMGDLAYILFRHKGKIVLCTLLGFAAALALWFNNRAIYLSEGKIMIRYVVENRSVDPVETGERIKSADGRDANIMNSEIELLKSFDLASEVARAVGATNILRALGGGDSEQAAAGVIVGGLDVRARPKSNVLNVAFRHPDPAIARQVVNALIAQYQRAHVRIHRALDAITEIARNVDVKREEVEKMEKSLRQIKKELGINSVQDAQRALTDLSVRSRSELLTAEAELTEARATLARLTNSYPAAAAAAVAALSPATNSPAPAAPLIAPPPEDVTRNYVGVLARLENLRRREQDLLLQFVPTSTYVKKVTAQIVEAQAERDRLVIQYPGLTNAPLPMASVAGGNQPTTVAAPPDPLTPAIARVESLEAKVRVLNSQIEKAQAAADRISDRESEISQLERKLQVGEREYTYYSSAFEKANADSTMGPSRLPNIAVFQGATPPRRDTSTIGKLVAGAAVGGLALGLALAALIEFFTDESVRRPRQVAEGLNLPLYLTLPKLKRLPKPGTGSASANGASPEDNGSPPDEAEVIRYSEALRDRLIMHFQIRDLTHKPKLIGVTSCGHGAGVTTLATSLAATLSETGEGNVLYVDVNQNGGPSVHPFRKGKPVVGIGEALAAETRDAAMVSENLYMVSLGDPNSRRVGILPKKLAGLVPQIKASDYDYIIFDLPPVSQTSATARVSGLLDITVMVLESERTHQDLARQAVGLLAESNTQMVAVLNKHRRYLPRKLDGDL